MKKNSELYPSWQEAKKLINCYTQKMPNLITKFRHLSFTEKLLLIQTIEENAARITFYLKSINAVQAEEKQEKRYEKLYGKHTK